jgi:protein-S-isoprenylcysteine O-methyltransferase Ste14
MSRKHVLFLSAFIGAVAGALAVTFAKHSHIDLSALFDNALLVHKRLLVPAFAAWVIFSIYWDIAARSATSAERAESSASRSVHVALTNIALFLEMPLRGIGRLLPIHPAIMIIGLIVEFTGVALAIWARRHLGRHWSGRIAINVDHQLIRTGPYRWLRHPIYTGLLAMYVGTAIVTGERLALIGLALAVYAYWRKIRLEEANLLTAFGPEYEGYRRDTWALLPGLF